MKIIGVDGVRGGGQTNRTLRALRELIASGVLAQGDRVPETWLVRRLGVSRTPVRAAIVRLHEEGLLEHAPVAGYLVRRFTVQDALDGIEARALLEGLAARRAAERGISESAIAYMSDLLRRIDVLLDKSKLSSEDCAAYVTLNDLFHAQVAHASGGDIVPHEIERLAAMPFAHLSGLVGEQAARKDGRQVFKEAQRQHRAVLDCLRARDAVRAEAVMREHAQLAARYFVGPGEAGAPDADRNGKTSVASIQNCL